MSNRTSFTFLVASKQTSNVPLAARLLWRSCCFPEISIGIPFEWSEKKGCRFFVRVYDQTKDEEKMVYKRHLRTVGEHFYYFEVLDDTFSQVQ